MFFFTNKKEFYCDGGDDFDQDEDGFAWPSGGTLFVSVRAQNGAGTWGAWITSDGARALCDAAQDASCVVEDVRGVLCVAL